MTRDLSRSRRRSTRVRVPLADIFHALGLNEIRLVRMNFEGETYLVQFAALIYVISSWSDISKLKNVSSKRKFVLVDL